MTNICINTLVGIPASGKSTFCRKIQSESKIFNVIHICYDDFIRMPNDADSPAKRFFYFESKQYKRQRFSLLWLIKQLIDDVKENSNFFKSKQVMFSDFPFVNLRMETNATKDKYLLLIDDTMHYKSMRKEIRTLARENELGFFVTYFHSTLSGAIKRNRNRSCVVDESHLERMHAIFECPSTDQDGDILHVDIDGIQKISTNSVELFALKCTDCPLKLLQPVSNPVIEQTVLHKADLLLRKSVNRKISDCKQNDSIVDLKEFAKMLCAKRSFVLNELRMGRIDVPEDLNELSSFIDKSDSL